MSPTCTLSFLLAATSLGLSEPTENRYDLNGDGIVVGLALSGGGLRATGVSYGVLLELEKRGGMKSVDLMSVVSGGSIIGAYYCLGLPIDEFGGKLDKSLMSAALGAFLDFRNLFDRKDDSRITGFADALDDRFYGRRKLTDLVRRPRLLINAVNVETANMFVFASDGAAGENITGDTGLPFYRLEPEDHRKMTVAMAVAASSAVPSVVNPLELRVSRPPAGKDKEREFRTVRLMDGGLFDNQGLESLLLRKCDVIIAVDASRTIIKEEGYTLFTPGGTKVIPITRRRYREFLTMYARERLGARFVRMRVAAGELDEVSPLTTKLKEKDLKPLVEYGRKLVEQHAEPVQKALER